MNIKTYQKFFEFAVEGKTIKHDINSLNLTDEEKELFELLRKNTYANRLEQERITQVYIKDHLNSALN